MSYQNGIRSALSLLAIGGLAAACAPQGHHSAARAPAANLQGTETILSQEVLQQASLKITSITDARGQSITDHELATMAGEGLGEALTQLRSADRAIVTKEAVQSGGGVSEKRVIDLRDKNGSVIRIEGDPNMGQLALRSSRSGFTASSYEVALNGEKISKMLFRFEGGRPLNVVVTFGAQQQEQAKQEQAKQEQAKQEEAKQEQAKQEAKQEEVKQEAKQEEVKQEAKQEEVKQEAKQEEVKQEAKQEEVKQEAKQEEVKQEAKQEEVKQEAKQEEVKQEAKQEEVKQEAKQEEVKQEAKQEEAKQEAKQDTGKQASRKMGSGY
jgi:chemotaxis protein histidine kinase CheA